MRPRHLTGEGIRPLLLVTALSFALVFGVVGCSTSSGRAERDTERLATAKRYYEAGKFPESEKTLTEVLNDSPENVDALQTMALAQAAQGKNEEAVEQYRKLVVLKPKDHASWYRMALLERITGDAKESAAHLERALEEKPGDPSYTDELARTKMSLGDYEGAATLWGSLLEDEKISTESRKELLILQGQAFQAAKDYESAKKAFAAALELTPDDEALQARLKSFE